MSWTHFYDMHSGGGTKEGNYEHILIEAPEDEAKVIFYNRFGHSPDRISCTCCGEDYSVSEYETIEEATAYHRGAEYKNGQDGPQQGVAYSWQNYKSIEEYVARADVLVVRKEEIKAKERKGELPKSGWIWCD